MNKKDYLLLEYLCEKYGVDTIEESFFKKLAPAAAAGILSLAGAAGIHNASMNRGENSLDNKPTIEQISSIEDKIPHYHELVQAVKDYMNWAVSCQGHGYDEVEIKPEKLVELCHEYEYDLPMLLSALHLESAMGITPRAKRTGSPCSIGCWDNGKDKVYYDDQNEAVEDYIKIMQDNFIRGRKYSDAFADGNLVNGIGLRYASNPKYEKELRSIRNRMFNIKNNELREKFAPLQYLSYYN